MGFYSPSQLIQDAQRHNICVLPIDINTSHYESALERTYENETLKKDRKHTNTALRLGFNHIKGLSRESINKIINYRKKSPFKTIKELKQKIQLPQHDIEKLASSDALQSISGHRFQALWEASDRTIIKDCLLTPSNQHTEEILWTKPPSIERNIILDQNTTGFSLRPHIMTLLRKEYPFKQCTQQKNLHRFHTGKFIQVAGLVTGRQRPATAKGTIFLTLEDETGNTNVVVWKSVQDNFRLALLNSHLLLVKGRLEVKDSVVHIIAGQLIDYTNRLEKFDIKSRDFH